MSPPEVLRSWIQRIISFDIDCKHRYKHRCRLVIGNIPPYPFISNKNYNPITRTLTCWIPIKYYDFVYPSEEEKQVALAYHVYYWIQR